MIGHTKSNQKSIGGRLSRAANEPSLRRARACSLRATRSARLSIGAPEVPGASSYAKPSGGSAKARIGWGQPRFTTSASTTGETTFFPWIPSVREGTFFSGGSPGNYMIVSPILGRLSPSDFKLPLIDPECRSFGQLIASRDKSSLDKTTDRAANSGPIGTPMADSSLMSNSPPVLLNLWPRSNGLGKALARPPIDMDRIRNPHRGGICVRTDDNTGN